MEINEEKRTMKRAKHLKSQMMASDMRSNLVQWALVIATHCRVAINDCSDQLETKSVSPLPKKRCRNESHVAKTKQN